jgi:hypothetical protein
LGWKEKGVRQVFMLHFSRTIAKLEGHIRRPRGEGRGLTNSQLPCAVVPKGKHRCDRGRPGPSVTLPQHLLVAGFWGTGHTAGKNFPMCLLMEMWRRRGVSLTVRAGLPSQKLAHSPVTNLPPPQSRPCNPHLENRPARYVPVTSNECASPHASIRGLQSRR